MARRVLQLATWKGPSSVAGMRTMFRAWKQRLARNVRGSIFDRVFALENVVLMTTAQAQALERLIIALDGHSMQAALDVASAMARVPGRVGMYLDALASLDNATLAALARDGLLLELASAPLTLLSITNNSEVEQGVSATQALLRGPFRGVVADLETFLDQRRSG